MQFTSFELNEEVKLSFNLAVSGTSSQPSEVRVTLGDKVKLLAQAKLNQAGEYEVSFPILAELFATGEHVLTVEVLLNGKFFTPVKQRVSINSGGIKVLATEAKKVTPPEEPLPSDQATTAEAKLNAEQIVEKSKIQFTKPVIKKKPVSTEKLDFSQFDTEIAEQIKVPEKRAKIQFTKPVITPKPITEFKLDFSQFETSIPEPIKAPEEKLAPEKVDVVSNTFKIQKTKIIEK